MIKKILTLSLMLGLSTGLWGMTSDADDALLLKDIKIKRQAEQDEISKVAYFFLE